MKKLTAVAIGVIMLAMLATTAIQAAPSKTRLPHIIADMLTVEGETNLKGDIEFNGTALTSTVAELNILDGVTSTASELNALDGITATVAELNLTDNLVADVTFAAAAGAANVCEVTITVKDGAGATIAGVFNLDIWLSDAATGAGLTGTTASGTVTAKAASGTVIDTQVSKKALRVQTLATGVFILEITDTGKTGFYVAAQVPGTGATAVSSQLVSGDYGA